jgi:hypothetical protein
MDPVTVDHDELDEAANGRSIVHDEYVALSIDWRR